MNSSLSLGGDVLKPTAVAVLFLSFTLSLSPSFAADRGMVVKPKVAPAAGQEKKTALVIGNSTYLVSPLKNPANDAKAMAKALRELGFVVDERTDRGLIEMKQAIEAFGKSIRSGGVGLFYYAGHGMQVDGQNYLIPVDANIEGEAEVDFKAVNAGLVLAKMELARNSMNIVILDACRNNPFSRSFRSVNQGLASMNAPSGTLIAYATAPGSVASDGAGANGLYTSELVKTVKKPGLRIEDVFKQVRSGVQSQTGGKQVPWESSSLVGDFFFKEGRQAEDRLMGLAEGSKERQEEIARLNKMEAEATKQKEKEQTEIAKKQKEIAALDSQIAAMKGKLGSDAAGPDDSLEKMVALVDKKEADARKLEELRKRRETEEAKRQAEIGRLKMQAEEKRRAEIVKDVAAYEKIVNSPYGKDMAVSAWQSLVDKYPDAKELAVGDADALKGTFSLPGGFVFVKGGCFQMGDTFGDGVGDEKPVHEVCVDDFFIGKYEVTQAEWEAVMGSNPSNFKQCGGNCPVEQVSWDDIQDFIRKRNSQTGKKYRLPTEAEWEYAARSGGKNEKYSGGSDLAGVAWYGGNSGGKTHPVGQKKLNELGIYDMSGNVWEWVADWYDWYDEKYYRNSSKDNPQGPRSGQYRSLRGGSWNNNPLHVRAAFRNRNDPANRNYSNGFRLAFSAR
jgi:formylglycine-generating enzyme required for sulfatase activity